ncbi:MAG: S-layer homology domain-containing protein, partial [Firmicutes bacterium]|nr:S-layer homology domain-containing protein [Bacillota bacterium]
NPVAVEIPVENMTAGTVAVIVYGDGTEEIVKTSVQGEDGIVVMLEGSETIKVIDNTKSFSDVSGNEWFAGNVAWAAAREIMKGIGGGIFDAGALTNRGMISQILFNLDGARATAAQEGAAAERFSDVSTSNWFVSSVGWMVANGIAQGRGDDFGATDPVTREQLAVMFFNYAKFIGADTSVSGTVVKFADGSEVSPWAQEAMAWAVGMGLIQGTLLDDGTIVLDPQGSSTRAMVAAITQRFCEGLF